MPRSRTVHPLLALVDSSSLPVYVLDDQQRVVCCNAACERWLGVSAASLVGQVCHYSLSPSEDPVVRAAHALCPPAEAFRGEACSAPVSWQGESHRLHFVPLSGTEPSSVLAVVLPAREADAAADELLTARDLHARLQALLADARGTLRLASLVGDSPLARRARDQVQAAVTSGSQVLLVGPRGSEREAVARGIAEATSPGAVVLAIDCADVTPEALESQAAIAARRSTSNGPPVFLLADVDRADEELQPALLAFVRKHRDRTRILGTATQDLIALAQHESFDRELAYALSTLVIPLPPLKDRPQDVPLLAQWFVEEYNAESGRQLAGVAPAALDKLAALPWHGDVAELRSVLREACQNLATVWIGEEDLPVHVRRIEDATMHPRHQVESIQLDEFLLEIEKELVERAMAASQGKKAQAARLLGVSRPRLLRRLEQLGLATPEEAVIDFQPIEDERPLSDAADPEV